MNRRHPHSRLVSFWRNTLILVVALLASVVFGAWEHRILPDATTESVFVESEGSAGDPQAAPQVEPHVMTAVAPRNSD